MTEVERAGPVLQVLLVDDHAMVRRGLRAYLGELGTVRVVGEADDGQVALTQLEHLAAADRLPDVVLMDLIMPGMDGVATTAAVHERYPGVQVVALTSFVDDQLVHDVLQAGALGYVLKSAAPDAIEAAIVAAAHGQVHLDPAAAQRLAASMAPVRDQLQVSLTEREREVLALVAQGCSNQDIADQLVLSERTVRSHVSSILGKLGLTSRTQAVLWAIRVGLVTVNREGSAPDPR